MRNARIGLLLLGAAVVSAACDGSDDGASANGTGGTAGNGGSSTGSGGSPPGSGGASSGSGGASPAGDGGKSTGGRASTGGNTPSDSGAGGGLMDAGPDAPAIPAFVSKFQSDVNAVSAAVRGRSPGGPQVCASFVPSFTVKSAAFGVDGIVEHVSSFLGISPGEIRMQSRACGIDGTPRCSSLFQHDVAAHGGPMSTEIMPLAEALESTSSEVRLATLVWSRNGVPEPDITVLIGVRDGWLLTIAIFPGYSICP